MDFAGAGEQEIVRFTDVTRALLASGEADTALLTGYFGGYAAYGDQYEELEAETARGMIEAARDSGRPLVVHTMYPEGPTATIFRAADVPVYGETAAAVAAVARLADRAERRPSGVPALPARAPGPSPRDGYFEARKLLSDAGIPFAEARCVQALDETLAAAGEIGYPVVLKALGLLHKSDAGGVALGISGEDELTHSYTDMATRLSPQGYSVERTAAVADGVELIVGSRRDPRFGPIVLVGLGGVYAELLKDVAVALAPITEAIARELLQSLRGAPLLSGARGRGPLDLSAAAAALAGLSLVAAERPEIAELEINPLLVTADGALGLDARIVLAKGESDAR